MNGVDSYNKKEDSFSYLACKPSSSQQTTRVTLFELITKKELEKFGVKVINLLSIEFQTLFERQKMNKLKDFNKEELLLSEFVKLNPDANFVINDFYFRRTRDPYIHLLGALTNLKSASHQQQRHAQNSFGWHLIIPYHEWNSLEWSKEI